MAVCFLYKTEKGYNCYQLTPSQSLLKGIDKAYIVYEKDILSASFIIPYK